MSDVKEAKPGDMVQLANKDGILADFETQFDISNDEVKPLGDRIGRRTQLALQSGGLLIVEEKTPKTKAKTDKKAAAETAKSKK